MEGRSSDREAEERRAQLDREAEERRQAQLAIYEECEQRLKVIQAVDEYLIELARGSPPVEPHPGCFLDGRWARIMGPSDGAAVAKGGALVPSEGSSEKEVEKEIGPK